MRSVIAIAIAFAIGWGFHRTLADWVFQPYDRAAGMLNAELEERFDAHYLSWHARYLTAAAFDGAARHEDLASPAQEFRDALRARLRKEQRPDGSWPIETGPGSAYATAVACLLLL